MTNRKPLDLAAAFQSFDTSFFAKEAMEFGNMWIEEYNIWNTPRQVVVGIWEFFSSHLEREAGPVDWASLPDTLASYQRVFTELIKLVNFSNLDK